MISAVLKSIGNHDGGFFSAIEIECPMSVLYRCSCHIVTVSS